MIEKGSSGWRRIWKAAGYSVRGLKSAWSNEAAFRQELLITAVLLPSAFWIGQTMTQRAVLIFSLLLVLMVELINSALETIVDRIGPQRHELSGRAKDMGSAAVMVSLIAAGVVWGLVILDKWD